MKEGIVMEECMSVPFDQYQRYRNLANLINYYREDSKKTFSILEIGSNEHMDLEKFLPDDSITFSDIVLTPEMKESGRFIEIDGTNIDLKDSSFDFVIAADVLEHIPQEKREAFILETYRVSKVATLLCFPFDNDLIREAERRLNNFYVSLVGEEYVWLKEHNENGLPCLEEINRITKDNNIQLESFLHGDLNVWEKMWYVHFLTVRAEESLPYLKEIDYFYNKYIFEGDYNKESYRNFLIMSHGDDSVWHEYINRISDTKIDKEKLNQLETMISMHIKNHLYNTNNYSVQQAIIDSGKLDEIKTKIDIATKLSMGIKGQVDLISSIADIKQIETLNNILKEKNNILEEKVKELDCQVSNLQGMNSEISCRYDAILNSTIWKMTKPVRTIVEKGYRVHNKLAIANLKKRFEKKIKFSVVMPVYNVEIKWLEKALASIKNQGYPAYEICIADDCSTNDEVRSYLKSINDPKIKVIFKEKNTGISDTTNKAAEMATGDYICLMDNDDELSFNCFSELNEYINTYGGDVLYTDQDNVDENGNHSCNLFKPDWSPDLLYSQMYVGHLLVVKTSLYKKIGGERSEFDGSQDYDLMLRLAKATDDIKHVPHILYHWRTLQTSTAINPASKPYAQTAGKRALIDNLLSLDNVESIEETKYTYCFDVRYKNYDKKASIIIPTKNHKDDLEKAINSILDKTLYKNYEIIILDNNTEETDALSYLKEIDDKFQNIKVVEAKFPFNWSKLNNYGVKYASGDVFVFLNNDIEIISGDWLERLIENSLRKEIACVGPMLLFPDGTIQHAGVVVGMGGWADHVYSGIYPFHRGTPFISPCVNRNVSAITGACLAVSREKYNLIGGFDENFIVCGSDIEFCLRAIKKGFYNLYNAQIRITHYESKTRDAKDIPEIDFKLSWEAYKECRENGDPFYNSNLDINSKIPTLYGVEAFPKVQSYVGELRDIHFVREKISRKRINLVIPSVNPEHVFGGISTAIKFFDDFCENLDCDKRIIVIDASPNEKAFEKIASNYVLVSNNETRQSAHDLVDLAKPENKTLHVSEDDYFILTIWYSFYNFEKEYINQKAQNGLKPNPFIYLIQDYEPGFYKWSSQYALCESTYRSEFDTIAVFNSNELADYMSSNYKFYKSYVFNPILNDGLKKYLSKSEKEVEKEKIILVYGRPTTERNAFGILVEVIRRWMDKTPDAYEWKILSAGEQHDHVYLGKGLFMESLGKLSIEEYAEILAKSYAGVSLMVSPHPSYPPLEMSVFGVQVITNYYDNKDLSDFSKNIHMCDIGRIDTMANELSEITKSYKKNAYIDLSNEEYVKGKAGFDFMYDLRETIF